MLSACGDMEGGNNVSKVTTQSAATIAVVNSAIGTTSKTISILSVATSQGTPTIPPLTGIATIVVRTSSGPIPDWQYQWLKSIPCKPPCWEGVTPGITTAEEAVSILKQNSLFTEAKINTSISSPNDGEVSWTWSPSLGLHEGRAEFQTQGSNRIIRNIDPQYKASFRLSEVIKAFGEPTHVIAAAYLDTTNVSKNTYGLVFIFLNQGIELGINTNTKPILNDTMEFSFLRFFEPTIEGYDKINGSKGLAKFLVSWQGYKDFEFYCRDPYGTGKEDCSKILKSTP